MSQFDVPTITAFSSLAVVALALVLQAQRSSGVLFALGLVGLLGLTAGLTWLVKVRSPVPGIEVRALAPEKPPSAPLSPSPRTVDPADDASTARKDAEAAKAEVTRLKEQLKDAQADAERARDVRRVEEQRRAHADMLATRAAEKNTKLDQRIKELEDSVAKLSRPEETPKSAERKSAPPQLVAGLGHLRHLLAKDVKTSFYAITPLADRELVSGYAGQWYQVTLQAGEEALAFPDRQFRAPDVMKPLQESAGHLTADVIAPLAELGRRHRVFVRGSADIRPISGATERPDIDVLGVLRRRTDGTYDSDPRIVPIARRVRNEQLPILRADWLRRQVGPAMPARTRETMAILDNPPDPEHDRSAVLLLFVDWSERDKTASTVN